MKLYRKLYLDDKNPETTTVFPDDRGYIPLKGGKSRKRKNIKKRKNKRTRARR